MAVKLPEQILDSALRGLPGARVQHALPVALRHGDVTSELIWGSTHEARVLAEYIREGRFQRSLAVVAGMSGLLGGLEVAYEHYRGSYGQRIMYSPVVLSAAVAVAGVASVFSRRAARVWLPISSWLLLADGVTGFVFHIRGINRKPGGWKIPIFNVIMGPPLFAPLLLGIGGFLGVVASFVKREDDPVLSNPLAKKQGRPPRGLGRLMPADVLHEDRRIARHYHEARLQQLFAGVTAASGLLNGLEALYSHYRTGYKYKAQWTPVLLAPLIVVSGIGAIFSETIARTALPIVSALGLLDGTIGVLYHVRGVGRRPGGYSHWLYNVLYGPPVFAPLLYAATGFMGLMATLVRRA